MASRSRLGRTSSFTLETPVHFRVGGHQAKRLLVGEPEPVREVPPGRVPRIARLVALSLHIDKLVRDGKVRDYADAARLAGLTRARVTQISNLSLLAPDIIEELLHLPRTVTGWDPITEHDLRPVAAAADWNIQRRLWREMAAEPRASARSHSGGVPAAQDIAPGAADASTAEPQVPRGAVR